MADQDRTKEQQGSQPRPGNGDSGARQPEGGRQDKSGSQTERERPTRTNDNDDR